jgi:DNA polymerase III epsilon subunit-like protein
MLTPHDFYLLGAGLVGRQVTEKPAASKQESLPAPDAVSDDEEEMPPLEEDPDLVVVKAKEVHQKPVIPADAFPNPVLCWDTETSGFKPASICQLAYQLYRDGTVTYYDKILQLPKGVKIHSSAKEKHGISDEMSAAGAPAGPELLAFWKLVQEVYEAGGVVVGHNVSFDCNAFTVSAEQQGLTQELDKDKMFDTMKMSSQKSTLKNKVGRKKQFNLAELYEALYGSPPSWAKLHSAGDDVHVTISAYYKGQLEGWW